MVCSSSLGNNANSASPPPTKLRRLWGEKSETWTQEKEQEQEQSRNLKTIERFAMQSAARALLPSERVAGCMRWAAFGAETIDCYHVPSVNGARIVGVQTCGSVWLCPVCAAKITERRRIELRQAVDQWRSDGGEVVMLTYTLRHLLSDSLADLMGAASSGSVKNGDYIAASGLMGARSRAMSGSPYHKLKKRSGLAGSVRAVEITHGENGWHPHIHELVFLDAGADVALLVIGLRKLWARGLAAAGEREVNRHSFEFTECGDEIENYIAKWGHEPTKPVWDCAAEVTKQPAKLGRAKGRSPMQLLSDFTATGDCEAGDLFRDYAGVMKGRRQLEWSRWDTGELTEKGRPKTISFLTHVLGVAEKTDAEVAENTEETGVLMAQLSLPQWRCIVADERRAHLLNILKTGDSSRLGVFLAPYQPTKPTQAVISDVEGNFVGLRPLTPHEMEFADFSGVVTPRLRLVKLAADERDNLVPLSDPFDLDPFVLSMGGGPVARSVARSLYARRAAGESVQWFIEQQEKLDEARYEIACFDASWEVSRHDLPSAVAMRYLCLCAVGLLEIDTFAGEIKKGGR